MVSLRYTLPSREEESAAIKQMSPDRVGKLRDDMKFRLEGLLESCDDYFKNLIESNCDICEKTGHAYFDIPQGWGWLSGSSRLICDTCISRWTERFGAPVINREGELKYELSSIPEDTTHRGQTTFDFV